MENFFTRYKNPLVLMTVLFIQVVMLATQVKRPENARAASTGGGTRLIRVWTVTAFTPIARVFVNTGHFFRDGWHNYADLRGMRKQNLDLQEEVSRLRMERVRLKQDADQARRLQALLDFKEKTITKTVAAQVIFTSGTEQSRVITIDKGTRAGLKPDMAVITPDGIVGKIKEVGPLSSQVMLINDRDSGAGVILETTRVQGILKGNNLGELQVIEVMSDETVEAGEHVITSGGDRIYPKGMAVGTVSSAIPDRDNDPYLNIKIKPAADLSRLEEVLVITETTEEPLHTASGSPLRAADILSERLPSIPKVDPNAPKLPATGAAATTSSPSVTADKKNAVPTPQGQKKETASGAPKPASSPTPTVKATSTDGKQPSAPAGTATPTPTPKPKATPAKPKAPAAATPTPPATQGAPDGSATPASTAEKPPR
ncbi:MAG TPA: rod shape-determining protein MreC [Candidatus Angelobacter sp.]|nr:rod shape-determining protein MreC [Candidatus Angelobacter sp.]